jgi:cell division septation protein DedD
MKNNETGEFELVVGNRQLLSAFFIVVLLFAVAFAMGYVVGQNSPRPAKMASDAGAGASAGADPGRDARPQAISPAARPAVTADPPAPAPADAPPQPTTHPAQGSPPEPAPAVAAALPAGVTAGENLPAGEFWQVMAVTQPQAEVWRKTLTDHGFAVVLTPGPKGLTRVLVGPYADTQALGKAKTDLENVGVRPPLRFKRD